MEDVLVFVLFFVFFLCGDGGSGEPDAADDAVDILADLLVGLAGASPGSTLLLDLAFLRGRLFWGGEAGRGAT